MDGHPGVFSPQRRPDPAVGPTRSPSEREVLPNVNVQENILEMKMTVFWDVALCSVVEVSEVLAASIIRAP
jgi:hypothetical protein